MKVLAPPLMRDIAALELTGYVIGLLRNGDIPAVYIQTLQERVDAVRRSQGMISTEQKEPA